MNRIFLGLAITVGTLLVVTFVLGLFVPHGQGGFARDLHFVVALATILMALMAHSIAYTYFLGTGKWVKEVVRVYQLPDWVWAQAVRNKRRAFPFALWSMLLVGAAAWLGGYCDTRRDAEPLWHLGMAAVAIAFNLGSFFVEYAAIHSQARLLIEVKDQADRLREAQLRQTAPAAS